MKETVVAFLQQHNLSSSWIVFIVSMVPVIELRGGIVVAKLLGLPLWRAYLLCVAGNMLPIPFILLFIEKIFGVMTRFAPTAKLVQKLEQMAMRKSDNVRSKQLLGLCIFVAIPLPGTGAWTGALIAALLHMPVKQSFVSIFAGVLLAGFIMSALMYFIPGIFGV